MSGTRLVAVCLKRTELEIPISSQIQLVGAIFAALLGLAFGSFLNVVISRLPEGESIATPRSHCRNCAHTLAWWENLPVLSWLLLRGRCRQCHTRISLRYPLIELVIGLLWIGCWLRFGLPQLTHPFEVYSTQLSLSVVENLLGYALLSWLLVALAALDAEHLWLPDWLTLPGIALGFVFTVLRYRPGVPSHGPYTLLQTIYWSVFGILTSAAIILIIRLAYWLVRRREGMGLGDAKLMAMLGAWLGLVGALESFVLAVFAASAAALIWLAVSALRRKPRKWAKMPLPLGTFLCLAALSEIFFPDWLWTWYSRTFLF